MQGDRRFDAFKARLLAGAALVACAPLATPAWAQTTPPAAAAPSDGLPPEAVYVDADNARREGDTIIATSSINAFKGNDTLIDYTATKGAIQGLIRSLAMSLMDRGIRVNAVAPGPIWTPLQVVEGQPKEKLPTFGHKQPLGRAGMPAELAGAYVFLASDDASYMTGQTMMVDGGSLMLR